MPSLTLSNAPSDDVPEPEVFDQTWAIADPRIIADETYQWTVDGVDTELVVSGSSLVRTRRQARHPTATMVTTTATLSALAAGETTVATAVESGDMVLNGPHDAIGRMFIVTALPGSVT
jgi:hypothetical protein